MRVSIDKLKGILIESQSGGETHPDPEIDEVKYAQTNLDILKQNAINAGHNEQDIEVKFVTDEEFNLIPTKTQAELGTEAVAAAVEATRIAAKNQSIIDNLPSWSIVKTAIIGAFPDSKQQKVILGIVRVVYWNVKNTEN